jgi:hypothetical protein
MDSSEIPALRSVQPVARLYPLLSSLLGRTEEDFARRLASIESLVASGRSPFGAEDLEAILSWMPPNARRSTVKALRDGGWLSHDPEFGTTITPDGRLLYEVFAALYRRALAGDLAPSIAILELMNETGQDPRRILAAIRSRMAEILEEILRARAQRTVAYLREAKGMLEETLSLSEHLQDAIRAIVSRDLETHRLIKGVLVTFAHLAQANTQLEEDLLQVTRDFVRLPTSITSHQVVRALVGTAKERLSEVGQHAVQPFYAPHPVVNTDALIASAEIYLRRTRELPPLLEWREPEPQPAATFDPLLPTAALALIEDLVQVADSGGSARLEEIVPHSTPTESLYRNALLSLLNEARARRGIAGRIARIPLRVDVQNDGWPVPLGEGPLSALTPGQLNRKEGQT